MRVTRAVFVAASAASSVGALLGHDRLHAWSKHVIAPALAADVLTAPGALIGPGRSTTARLVAGLVGSGVGDHLMLAESRAHGAEARVLLRRGAAAFALQQVALLAQMHAERIRVERSPRALTAMSGLGALAVIDGVAARRDGASVAPHPVTSVYGLLLCTMAAMAQSDPRTARGGALFLASDAVIVARQLITPGRMRRAADAVVMASYTAALGLLIDGLRAPAPTL